MNLLLDVVISNGLLLDALGVVGLGLLGLAAVKLARRHQSWGGNMMAAGAICLLVARLYIITAPHFVTRELLAAVGPIGIAASIGLPTLLLTFGLAGVVWGLWGHGRWMREEGH